MEVSAADLAESVAALVRIPSVNPLHTGAKAQAAGELGEATIAGHLADRFAALGASEVVLDEAAEGRPNVYGFFPGRTDRIVVVDVHMDTVTVEHMTEEPFDGRIEDGYVCGRGALDTKASMGVMMALLAAWQRAGVRPEPTVLLVGSIAEEAGGMMGARRFREWADERGLTVDQMIIAEPTDLAPIHGHKGAAVLQVTTHGVAAHTSRPHLGKNAIYAMAKVIAAYEAEHERLQTLTPETELGHSTITVAMIEGGTGGNVVPASCTIQVGQRVVPEIRRRRDAPAADGDRRGGVPAAGVVHRPRPAPPRRLARRERVLPAGRHRAGSGSGPLGRHRHRRSPRSAPTRSATTDSPTRR